MTQLYWHAFSVKLSDGGYLTLIAGESEMPSIPLPFMAPRPFDDDQTEVEWEYLGTWNHEPSSSEKDAAELGAGHKIEPISEKAADAFMDLIDKLDKLGIDYQ